MPVNAARKTASVQPQRKLVTHKSPTPAVAAPPRFTRQGFEHPERLNPAVLLQLQRAAGNRAVTSRMAQPKPAVVTVTQWGNPNILRRGFTDEQWQALGIDKAEFGTFFHSDRKVITKFVKANNMVKAKDRVTAAREKAQIKKRIQEEYGISLDSSIGIKAANEQYFKDPTEAAKNPLDMKTGVWTVEELRNIEKVLKNYAPVLGKQREASTQKGTAQPITNFSRIQVGLDFVRYSRAGIITNALAKGHTLAQINAQLSLTPEDFEARGLGPKANHAILTAAMEEWKKANTNIPADEEASGYTDLNVKLDPGTRGETFRAKGDISLYSVINKEGGSFPGDIPKSARKTIAHELAHALIQTTQEADFLAKFSDYWISRDRKQDPLPPTAEAPITRYGTTNVGEDIAEMAGFYFVDRNALLNGFTEQNPGKTPGQPGNPAPRRKEYMDRVVMEWTSQPIKNYGIKYDAVMNMSNGTPRSQVEKAFMETEDAFKTLSPQECWKVDLMVKKLKTKYNALILSAPKPAPKPVAPPTGTK